MKEVDEIVKIIYVQHLLCFFSLVFSEMLCCPPSIDLDGCFDSKLEKALNKVELIVSFTFVTQLFLWLQG